jgi:hypothetical protein
MALNNCFGVTDGDFDLMTWTGAIWMLYGGCGAVAPGPWRGTCEPPRPSNPDPAATFDWPKYQASGFMIPIQGHPIGVPCSSGNGPNETGELGDAFNTGVEMAELQIWVDQSIDTGKEQNRRLFIDYPKDKDGNPDKRQGLRPVPPKTAEKTLGRPHILIHGTNNWKHGRNTGTSGIETDADGNHFIKPEGQFTPVAKIEKFVPDPELGR